MKRNINSSKTNDFCGKMSIGTRVVLSSVSRKKFKHGREKSIEGKIRFKICPPNYVTLVLIRKNV